MSIHWIKGGNIFESECRVLVNPVNALGVHGAGLAKQFAKRFPNACSDFSHLCRVTKVEAGTVYYYEDRSTSHDVLFFVTKEHWRYPSRIEWITYGLIELVQSYEVLGAAGITSIALPALGCGLGGLDWRDVRPLMESYLQLMKGVEIEVYCPR